MSPVRNFELMTVSMLSSLRNRCACVSARAFRSVSACALPRPSAMASAKLANKTVNHSQSVICSPKPKCPAWCAAFQINWMVVTTAPTSTTNMTGFFAIVRGVSLRKESTMARERIALSANDFLRICVISEMGSIAASENLPRMHQQMFQNRPEAQGRKESQGSHN